MGIVMPKALGRTVLTAGLGDRDRCGKKGERWLLRFDIIELREAQSAGPTFRSQCRVATTSRYALGTTMVPSVAMLNSSMSTDRSCSSAIRVSLSSAVNAFNTGP